MFKRASLTLMMLIFSTSLLAVSSLGNNYPPIPQLTPEQLSSNAIFTAAITVRTDGHDVTKTFSAHGSIQEIIDTFQGTSLEHEFPTYKEGQSSLAGTIDLRGVQVTATTAFGTTTIDGKTYKTESLHFCFNGQCEDFTSLENELPAGLKAAFEKQLGTTNAPLGENVWDQLINWLKGSGGEVLTKLADSWVEQTSIDPVAGNPNSLMAQLTNYNFNLATDDIMNASAGLNLFSITPSYVQSKNNNYSVKDFTLPLRYSHFFNSDNALFLDVPLNYTQIETAETYSLALGLGYTHIFIVHPHLTWSLTPSFYVGAVGSIDLGSGTLIYNPAIASRITLPYAKWTYGLTDDISYLKTARLKLGDTETPYDMQNTLTQNGIDVTYRLHRLLTVGGYIKQTNVLSGIKWNINNYTDVGFKLAKLKYFESAIYDHISLSMGFIFGANDYEGGNVTLGFNF